MNLFGNKLVNLITKIYFLNPLPQHGYCQLLQVYICTYLCMITLQTTFCPIFTTLILHGKICPSEVICVRVVCTYSDILDDIEAIIAVVQSLIYYSSLLNVLRVERVALGVLSHQVGQNSSTETNQNVFTLKVQLNLH